MLDYYKETQPIVYNVLMNEIKNNKVSHAYLIDENNNQDAFNIVMAFVKEILCNNITSEEAKSQLIKRIDENNYSEIKIIEPDGMLIKKQQILDLQKEFSMSSIEGKKRIYIIRDADKMRSETANSMLKFLEEPENDLVAILMTNNFNNLLSTIVSRCQNIRLFDVISDSEINEIDSLAINFVETISKEKYKAIVKLQSLVFDHILPKERDKLVAFFDKIIDIYYDLLLLCNGNMNIKNSNNMEILKHIANKSNSTSIIEKINYLITVRDSIRCNVNSTLLIDSVIVKLGGSNENYWS